MTLTGESGTTDKEQDQIGIAPVAVSDQDNNEHNEESGAQPTREFPSLADVMDEEIAVVADDGQEQHDQDSNTKIMDQAVPQNQSQVEESKDQASDATKDVEELEEKDMNNNSVPSTAMTAAEDVTGEITQDTKSTATTTTTASFEQYDVQQHNLVEQERLRMMEEMHIGTASEILFLPTTDATATANWDNLRWMSLSGTRKVVFSRIVFRRVKEQTTIIMWKSSVRITYPARLLVLYEHPQVLLILRRAHDLDELSTLTAVDYKNNKTADGQQVESADQILQHYWIAESVVDLTRCKLQLSPLTTHDMSQIIHKIQHDRERSSFQIITPSDVSIVLSAVQVRPSSKSKQELSFTDSGAFMETTSTEKSLIQAIYEAHHTSSSSSATQDAQEQQDTTWKHQVILGTLHAHVLSGNTKALDQALDRTWRKFNTGEEEAVATAAAVATSSSSSHPARTLPHRIIDETDDSSHPPIYYACRQGMNDATTLLIQYGASLDYTTSPDNDSLLHICARNLDYKGLQTLLSADGRRPPLNPNAVNDLGETPLYAALVYGKHNSKSLGECIQVLKSHNGRIFGPGRQQKQSTQQHPLLVLAMEYRTHDIEVLLPFLPLDFPLNGNTDIVSQFTSRGDHIGESLAALYGYPLHRVLETLYRQAVEPSLGNPPPAGGSGGGSGNSLHGNNHGIVGVVRLLLQCGFEANERLDGGNLDAGTDSLALFVGFAPIQILAVTALELEKEAKSNEELNTLVSHLCEELIKTGGARLSLEVPPMQRKRSNNNTNNRKATSPLRQKSSTSSVKTSEEASKTTTTDSIDRANIKIDANDHLMELLGGRERLKAAQASYSDLGSVMLDQSRAPFLLEEANSNIEDSDAPGGSSDKSCAICWRTFGALVNRKHRCRISWKHVADECSTKRIIVNGKEYRVSDGQFVRAKALVEAKVAAAATQSRTVTLGNASTPAASSSATAAARARLQRLEAEEQANRDSLFGGDVMEQAKSMLFGNTMEEKEKRGETMDGLMNSLGETRNALLERGDKLSSLNDKSAQMVSASEDFAKLV